MRQLVEFRNYTLVPGGAGAFAAHFERYFLDSQAALGMDIVGRFTVPGDDARFVWVRRFLEPAARGEALHDFYGGPVWKEFGPRANELLVDHTDVHLLAPDPSLPCFPAGRRTEGADEADEPSSVVAALYDLPAGRAAIPPDMATAMSDTDAPVVELGRLVTAAVPNDFPRLPVHEDRTIALWLLSGDPTTTVAAAEALAPTELHHLTPTGGSPLR